MSAELIDEAAFTRALVRRFRAREIPQSAEPAGSAEPPSSLPPSNTLPPSSDVEKCALCRRPDKLGTIRDEHGRLYCREAEWPMCDRIAQGRLGASASNSTSASALRGELHPDGTCRNCKAPVKWVKTQRGKSMPVDVSPAPPGKQAFELIGRVDTLAFFISERKREKLDGDVYESHFQTCAAGRD